MSHDDETHWLKTRMDRMRERRERCIPSFEQTWRAAEARPAKRGVPVLFGNLLLPSAAVVLAAVATGFWGFARWQHSQRIERDFATVEGALVTYWQAPSDALLESVNGNETAEP